MASSDMDDLISAFSNTACISQESIDLRALQTQLANSLMQSRAGPCPTTPTMGTIELAPSSSSSTTSIHQQASNSQGWGQQATYQQWSTQAEDEEDMQMVEDSLLFGFSSQSRPRATPTTTSSTFNYQPQPTAQVIAPANDFASYAAVDPFFAAQLQAAQQPLPSFMGYGFHQPHQFATPTY